jgi:hypothetical protein
MPKGATVAGLADEIKSEPSEHGGIKRRRIWQIADSLDAEDRAAFVAALNDFSVPAASIRRVLAKRNIRLSESVISNYRNGHYGTL